ncbi:hypothetical protein UREG_06623 [Uncinocarpus reesii 1704]|uniref:Aminoacyl-transfer RNA synthetases class-II family profile domain-containing protein n=1 Tax=Uncinocarpus reesii (strain UAMH 1704) TaxID=336963 RepID=C4JVN1_UNCRE|nr:uncharacterized protein UREG_06623 [Uncinocarpus reesii 1704]EEP81758.1 hypothetical protein UREG_06623 [Uncinocarpus reesii 1704]
MFIVSITPPPVRVLTYGTLIKIAIIGKPHRTSRGELTLLANELPTLLSPCLHDVPVDTKEHEVSPYERHVQFLADQGVVDSLKARSSIIQHIRNFFLERNFTEVSTPIIASAAGGATARPFHTTASESPDRLLALRIAPELWLKRLIVGGFDRIFEIGPSFRNEGLDKTHNPEFTTCEFYQAFADLERLMQMTRSILAGISHDIKQLNEKLGTLNPTNADFNSPFQQLDFIPALESAIGRPLPDLKSDDATANVVNLFNTLALPLPDHISLPRLLDKLCSAYLEPRCENPTFIINHPECMSPLAKSHIHPTCNQVVSARAELFVEGKELVNMYEEENSPFEQRRKFEEQLSYRDPENPGELDEGYLQALEWGLPPTGGWGCGIDRLRSADWRCVELWELEKRDEASYVAASSRKYSPITQALKQQYYNYTSGRWLWDEANQFRKRYQPFDIQKLKGKAAECVNAASCTRMIKLTEGAYNKAFLLTIDNGVQVVARIPNPFIHPRVATASEVATLDFLRNELDIPVPRVLAWSSDKNQDVEAEYIIMEKAPGTELAKCWPSMDIADKFRIATQLAELQKRFSSVDFGHYGSLYYRGESQRHDIPGFSNKFCIGPAAAPQFWDAERKQTGEYKGPSYRLSRLGSSPVSFMKDIARREMSWLSQFARPRQMSDPLRQSATQESPECHLQLLQKYLKIIPQVIPLDNNLRRATIWHPDLHSGNIFIENNTIVCIIDWQGCMSLPLFLTCKIPKFLRFNGPLLINIPPTAGLSTQEKADILLRYQLTQLQRFYIARFDDLDRSVFRVLADPYATTRQQLVEFAGSTWEDDGLLFLRERMRQVWHAWADFTNKPGEECPITFSADELATHNAEMKAWDGFNQFFDFLGIPMDGWVHPEDFKLKAETMQDIAGKMVSTADDQEEARCAIRAWNLSDPEATHPLA